MLLQPGQGWGKFLMILRALDRWMIPLTVYRMIAPELLKFLQVYRSHMRYYLLGQGRYTDEA